MRLTPTATGLQARVWTVVRLQLRSVHLWSLWHGYDHLFVSSLRRRRGVRGVVLVDSWYWCYVPGFVYL